jgi:ribosome-associated protein YbcJ (S4-like RNA binding protein)
MDEGISQLPALIKQWMTEEDELNVLSAAVREKRKRAKLVREMIVKIMKTGKIGQLKTSAGAVVARSKSIKAPMSKKYLAAALTDFFEGDSIKAAACAQFLDENRPLKAKDNLSLEPT